MGRERACHLRYGHSGEVRQRTRVLVVVGARTDSGNRAHWLHRVRVTCVSVLGRWISNRGLGIGQCGVFSWVGTEWRSGVVDGRFQHGLEVLIERSGTGVRPGATAVRESVLSHGKRRSGLEGELGSCRDHGPRGTNKLERWRLLQGRVMRSRRGRI